jgi:hypothetical protein
MAARPAGGLPLSGPAPGDGRAARPGTAPAHVRQAPTLSNSTSKQSNKSGAGLAPSTTPSPTAPPPNLCCPITYELMWDPVVLSGSGHTYERLAIEAALHRRRADPLTSECFELCTTPDVQENGDLQFREQAEASQNRPAQHANVCAETGRATFHVIPSFLAKGSALVSIVERCGSRRMAQDIQGGDQKLLTLL